VASGRECKCLRITQIQFGQQCVSSPTVKQLATGGGDMLTHQCLQLQRGKCHLSAHVRKPHLPRHVPLVLSRLQTAETFELKHTFEQPRPHTTVRFTPCLEYHITCSLPNPKPHSPHCLQVGICVVFGAKKRKHTKLTPRESHEATRASACTTAATTSTSPPRSSPSCPRPTSPSKSPRPGESRSAANRNRAKIKL